MSASTVVTLALLLLVPAAWAALLRWARCPGWPVMGGVVAGIILGPTVFGRVLPDRYDDLLVGGRQQQHALQVLTGQQGADRLVAERAGLDDAAISALDDRLARARIELEDLYRDAAWSHQRPLRAFVCVIVALMLAGAAAHRIPPRGDGQTVGALSMGAWSGALPGGLAFFFMRWAWDAGVHEAALTAAAVAIGPWALTEIDRRAADQAELGGARLIQTAGRVATVIALALALGALWHARQGRGLLWGASLAAVVLGWLIPVPSRALTPARAALNYLVVPAVAASVAVKVDLLEIFAFWPCLVILLLSGDGRWLGAFAGATILGGRRGLRTMRLVLGSMAAGPTQLAVTAVAIHTWLLSPQYGMALLLGATLIELMTPARRGMANRLIRTEEELEQDDEN
ncbi:MAG: hypothetical protein ACYTGF_08225 [Planctomycetota bacterium]|jgi:hypothetical protein